MNDPILSIAYFIIASYIFLMWHKDAKQNELNLIKNGHKANSKNKHFSSSTKLNKQKTSKNKNSSKANKSQKDIKPLEGAYFANLPILFIGIFGSGLIFFIAFFTEQKLGLLSEQKTISYFSIFALMGAAIIEELIFRGYLVVKDKTKFMLVLSIFAFSLIFTIIHPFFWQYEDGKFSFIFTTSAITYSLTIFINSLWFYFLRFNPLNKKASLLPCFGAHIFYNVLVYLSKFHLGFLE